MSGRNFLIRNMTRRELDIAVEWAANEGWNPGLYDADCFYSTDSNGFFMGFLDGEPVTCISAVAYNKKFGFLGFYITKKEYRGQGYGIKVWRRAMDYLKTQNIGLDGVLAQQENYQKSGFELVYHNIRYQNLAKHTELQRVNYVKISSVSFDKLVAYDDRCFPTSRPQFLKCWISVPESFAIASVIKNQVIGYGVIRMCRKGYKAGPLFADDYDTALGLYQSLCNQVAENTQVYLDVPEVNKSAVKLARTLGMEKVFETARMYTKGQPKIDLSKIYGVTTFELG